MVCLSPRSRPCGNYERESAHRRRNITAAGVIEEGKTVYCGKQLWLPTNHIGNYIDFIVKNSQFDLHHFLHLQSEDDCVGHETTSYAFFIDDSNVRNMTADMPGLRSFNKRGDVADVTLSVPTHCVSSSPFNLTVVLSNTVEFTEMIISSSNGVSSVLRSNSWYTTSRPYYCECKFDPHGTVCSCLAPSDNMTCISFECA